MWNPYLCITDFAVLKIAECRNKKIYKSNSRLFNITMQWSVASRIRINRRFSVRLQYLRWVSNGYTTVVHWAIEIIISDPVDIRYHGIDNTFLKQLRFVERFILRSKDKFKVRNKMCNKLLSFGNQNIMRPDIFEVGDPHPFFIRRMLYNQCVPCFHKLKQNINSGGCFVENRNK